MHFYGVYRGVVTDNNDPAGLGRVKIDLKGQGVSSPGAWALVCLPAAAGHFAKIQIGAAVIVAFEGGDPVRPVVLGRVATQVMSAPVSR